jgi:CopA family copper-resistance protein
MLHRLLSTTAMIVVCLVGTWRVACGAVVEYHLTIAEQPVNITGRTVTAMAINGTIPGPVLRFTEGDIARIQVRNAMPVDTSIHWHGILVPPEMDGVPDLSFPPIAPGATFTYEFPIRQSGTYWYHSHSGLQEQRGVYGSIVIAPREPGVTYDRDHVVLLSDWTDEDPHEVLRTLKRGSEWYAVQKGSAQTLLGAARARRLKDYWTRELLRMPAMDIADVAYDRFLANGNPQTRLLAATGETVRLRIINGSSTTFYHLEYSGGPMTIIAADGIDVEPMPIQRLLIGVAETYDMTVRLPDTGAYELRATAQDGSGYASVWLGDGMRHSAPTVPKPDIYQNHMTDLGLKRIFAITPAASMGMSDEVVRSGKLDTPGMAGMGAMEHGAGHHMPDMPMEGMEHHKGAMDTPVHEQDMGEMPMPHDHAGHAMPTDADAMPPVTAPPSGTRYATDYSLFGPDASSGGALAEDGSSARPWAPYEQLRATRPTAFADELPVREIRLTLDGDMERYVWFLNNRPLSESDVIPIRAGEVVRFIMINRTMMHHPMHLHGHFFRVINQHGDYAPLKHTVDVAPMSTTVIEFKANEVGDWFFHCHLLYHMMSGMARVVHYEGYTPSPEVAALRPRLIADHAHIWGQVDAMSNRTEGFVTRANSRTFLTATWEVGWRDVEETEWEVLLTWDRYLNRFASVFVGVDAGNAIDEDRGVLGVRYLLPLNIETAAFVGTDGEARLAAGKHFDLLPRLSVAGDVQYDTAEQEWESEVVLSYLLNKQYSLVANWHSEYKTGAGLRVRF